MSEGLDSPVEFKIQINMPMFDKTFFHFFVLFGDSDSLELAVDLLGDVLALLRVETEHDDPGAPPRQLFRGLVTHARVAARHQRSLPVQPTIGLNRE